MALHDAVEHPRIHAEVFDSVPTLAFEPGMDVGVVEGLAPRRFPDISMYFGGVQAALWDSDAGHFEAADPGARAESPGADQELDRAPVASRAMDVRDFVGLMLDPDRIAVLGHAAAGSIDVAELADALGVPPKRIQQAVSRLVGAGLLTDALELDREALA